MLRLSGLCFLFSAFLLSGEAPTAPPVAGSGTAVFKRIGPFGGDVRSLLLDVRDARVVFAGTSDGQIFRSADGGETWTPIVPGLGRRRLVVDTLVQHPGDPVRLFAGAWDLKSDGGELFESSDGGTTWSPVRLPQASVAVRGIAVSSSSPSRMVVGAHGGVYATEDGGKKWVQIGRSGKDFPPVESVAIDPLDPRSIYAGTWRLSYRSRDFGRTWTRVPQGMLLDSHVFSLMPDPRNPAIVYAGACSGVYRSINGARSWTRLKVLPGKADVRAHIVTIDPSDSHRLYVGSTQGLYVSENDGRSWKRLTDAQLTVHAVQVDPRNPRRVLLGTENQGVLASEDSGRTWKSMNRGLAQFHVARVLPDGDQEGRFLASVLSSGACGGVYAYRNHGEQWQALSSELAARSEVLSVARVRATGTLLAGTARGLYSLSPGTPKWVLLGGPPSHLKVMDLAEDPKEAWVYAATEEGVYRARPDRLEFQKPDRRRYGPFSTCLAFAGKSGEVFAGGIMGVLRSADNGATWVAVSSGLPMRATVQCLAVDGYGRHMYAGTMAGLYESENSGDSWRKVPDGRLGVDVTAVAFLDSEGQAAVAADNSHGFLYLSTDAGRSWTRIESPGFGSSIRSIAQDPHRPSWLYLGTSSEGVYRLQLPETVFRE